MSLPAHKAHCSSASLSQPCPAFSPVIHFHTNCSLKLVQLSSTNFPFLVNQRVSSAIMSATITMFVLLKTETTVINRSDRKNDIFNLILIKSYPEIFY